MSVRTSGVVAAGVCVLLFTSSASANWQFTNWGMTPAQVIAKSAGRAADFSDASIGAGQTLFPKLSMPYSSGNFSFTAVFEFDASNRLGNVTLKLVGGDPQMLRSAMTQKYGKPQSDHFGIQQWLSKGDQIILMDDEILYSPSVNKDNSGL